jgi:hypothetical protein
MIALAGKTEFSAKAGPAATGLLLFLGHGLPLLPLRLLDPRLKKFLKHFLSPYRRSFAEFNRWGEFACLNHFINLRRAEPEAFTNVINFVQCGRHL